MGTASLILGARCLWLFLVVACSSPKPPSVVAAPAIPELEQAASSPSPSEVAPLSTVTDPCAMAATVDRTCAVDADCTLVKHTGDCCGTMVMWAIATPAKAAWLRLEGACATEIQQCKCEAGPTTADDHTSGPNFAARCLKGRCESFTAR